MISQSKIMFRQVKGFTLLEVLIAVMILAISLTALLRANQISIRNHDYLYQKNLAMWLAQNSVYEIQYGLLPIETNTSRQKLAISAFKQRWIISIHLKAIEGTSIKTMTLSVSQPTGTALAVIESVYY